MLQDNVFLRSEGDRWFVRNRSALDGFDAGADLPLRLMSLYNMRPECVVEIGAANGFRLAEIHRHSGARVIAVEPSAQAIAQGKAAFPSVSFVRAAAHSIPLRQNFDLVIVNFVLHWIDRILFRVKISPARMLAATNSERRKTRLVCSAGLSP